MYLARTVKFILVTVIVLCSLTEIIVESTDCTRYSVTDTVENKCVDFEWCLYKFYTKSLSWFDAKAVCEQDNLTLAKITDSSQQTFLSSLMINSLSYFDANHPSSVWIGAYRASDKKARWQDGCNHVDGMMAVTGDGDEACFLFDGNSTFASEECSTSQPFLCQASTLDTATCFTNVSPIYDATPSDGGYIRKKSTECFLLCQDSATCVGFRYSSKSCIMLTYSHSKSYAKGTELYKKDLLRTVPSGVTASISNLDNLCSTTVTTSNQQTQSTWPSSTAYTPTSAVTGIATLEPSSTDPTAVIETSSESTPPLSNVVTSVKLEITSLPTATEKTGTISATCSTCSCIKPTPVDQNKLEESLSKLKEQLLINPKKLSSYKRALTSAPDDRKSAANIGYIGILVLCLVPGIIILLDMGRLIREFKQFIIRLRNSQRTIAKITPIERT